MNFNLNIFSGELSGSLNLSGSVEFEGTLNDMITTYGSSEVKLLRTCFNGEEGNILFFPLEEIPTDVSGCIWDFNPENTSSLSLSSSDVLFIGNSAGEETYFTGSGHEPTLETTFGGNSVKSIKFEGPKDANEAEQWLDNFEFPSLFETLSNPSGSFKEWSMFVVLKLNDTPSSEAGIFDFNLNTTTAFYQMYLYNDESDFVLAINNESHMISSSSIIAHIDLNKHMIEISSNGSGTLTAYFDEQFSWNMDDISPRNIGGLSICANPVPGPHTGQNNAQVARILVFNHDLTTQERTLVRESLHDLWNND